MENTTNNEQMILVQSGEKQAFPIFVNSNQSKPMEPEKPMLRLFKGVTIPKDDEQVHNAMMYFYKAKNENVNNSFMEVIGRVKKLTHTISDLNLPLLLSPEIEAKEWNARKYSDEMLVSVDDLVESIKSDIAYGRIKHFCQYYQLSSDWLLHGVNTGEQVNDEVYDDDVITLGKLTGDIESNLQRAKAGSVEYLNHRHKPVHLPTLDTVNQELGHMAEEACLEDHLEDLVRYETENEEQQPILPDKPNPTGITNYNAVSEATIRLGNSSATEFVIKSHDSGQKLPKSKLRKVMEANGWLNSDKEIDLDDIPLEKLMNAIARRLDTGITITIVGK